MSTLLHYGCFLVFCQDEEGKEGRSRGHKRYSTSIKQERKNYTATSNKRWASIHGSDGSRLLFTSHAFQSVLPTQELLPSPSTAKLSLILAGARERDCPACTERGAIDGCGTALTAYTRLFNYVRKAWIFLQVSLLALSSSWLWWEALGLEKKESHPKYCSSLMRTKLQPSLYNTCKPLWKQHQNSQKGIREMEHDTKQWHVSQVRKTHANTDVPWSKWYWFLCLFCVLDKAHFTACFPKSFWNF